MSIRVLSTAATAALWLALAPLAQAQAPAASAPAAAPAPAPAAAKAAAPAAAAAPAGAEDGKIAFYGRKFAGRKTASGERFDPNALTMAHKTLPFGTLVRVTNPKNHRSVVLRVNDRGPSTADRVGDVTTAAAKKLGFRRAGVIAVKLEVVGKGKARHGKKAAKRHARRH